MLFNMLSKPTLLSYLLATIFYYRVLERQQSEKINTLYVLQNNSTKFCFIIYQQLLTFLSLHQQYHIDSMKLDTTIIL